MQVRLFLIEASRQALGRMGSQESNGHFWTCSEWIGTSLMRKPALRNETCSWISSTANRAMKESSQNLNPEAKWTRLQLAGTILLGHSTSSLSEPTYDASHADAKIEVQAARRQKICATSLLRIENLTRRASPSAIFSSAGRILSGHIVHREVGRRQMSSTVICLFDWWCKSQPVPGSWITRLKIYRFPTPGWSQPQAKSSLNMYVIGG